MFKKSVIKISATVANIKNAVIVLMLSSFCVVVVLRFLNMMLIIIGFKIVSVLG